MPAALAPTASVDRQWFTNQPRQKEETRIKEETRLKTETRLQEEKRLKKEAAWDAKQPKARQVRATTMPPAKYIASRRDSSLSLLLLLCYCCSAAAAFVALIASEVAMRDPCGRQRANHAQPHLRSCGTLPRSE